MEAGFLALYKRGTYFRGNIESLESEQRERKHQERERFAMAALAFCLTHHAPFRQHFLKVVCDISRPQSEPKIGIEDKLWGDLVIRTNNAIFVIEGKIKAKLQDHQNPTKGRAFWRRGYGHAILEQFKDHPNLHYILLGYPKPIALREYRHIACHRVFWSDLEKDFPAAGDQTDMATDLADCLAELQVDAFYLRKTRTMRISKPNETAKAFDVLRGTLKAINASQQYIHGEWRKDGWEYGSEIRPSRSKEAVALTKLRRAVKPIRREAVGWFGWQSANLEKGSRSVWFYCGNERIRKVFAERLKNRLKRDYFVTSKIDEDQRKRYLSVEPARSANQTTSDQEWFLSVFKVLDLINTDR